MDKKQLTKRYLAHFGAILTHLGIAGLVYSGCALFSGFLVVCYMLILLAIALGTIFLAFAIPEYRAMWANLEGLSNFVADLYNSLYYVIPVTLGLMVLGLVFLLMDKQWEKSKSRIITNIVILSILVVLFIIFIVGAISSASK